MAISKRQFTLLNEMGINLWVSRSTPTDNNLNDDKPHLLDIDLAELSKNKLFNDIINSIDLSIGEVSCSNDNTLNLGLFNWVFTPTSTVEFSNNLLSTPSIDKLADSPQLKSQLWKNIYEQRIC